MNNIIFDTNNSICRHTNKYKDNIIIKPKTIKSVSKLILIKKIKNKF